MTGVILKDFMKQMTLKFCLESPKNLSCSLYLHLFLGLDSWVIDNCRLHIGEDTGSVNRSLPAIASHKPLTQGFSFSEILMYSAALLLNLP